MATRCCWPPESWSGYAPAFFLMSGKELASGKVRSGGTVTGSYLEKADGEDAHTALVIWQNDTVVFRAQGQRAALEAFYKAFPL